VLIAVYLLVGFNPQIAIFTFLTQTTFAGLAALTPAALAALYRPQLPKGAVILSILTGEAVVVLMRAGILPTYGLADGVIALAAAGLGMGVVVLVKRFRSAG